MQTQQRKEAQKQRTKEEKIRNQRSWEQHRKESTPQNAKRQSRLGDNPRPVVKYL